MLTLLLLGALFPIHMARAWRGRLNRVSGSIMVVCNAVLIMTAFGLYYLGAETLRPWASDVHIVAGFALPVLIAFHIWLGRRQNALPDFLVKSPARLGHRWPLPPSHDLGKIPRHADLSLAQAPRRHWLVQNWTGDDPTKKIAMTPTPYETVECSLWWRSSC